MATTTKSVLIEIGEEAAGVLVETPNGLVFHSVHARLMPLHGAVFKSVAAAQAAAKDAFKGLAKAG
jgi:hypothetical protein